MLSVYADIKMAAVGGRVAHGQACMLLHDSVGTAHFQLNHFSIDWRETCA